jgi:circadian clock protein KaiB
MAPSSPAAKLLLRLYVIAGAPNSIAARANLTSILSATNPDSFALEVVDCVADPHRALADGVLVTPTLVKVAPEPGQTIIGSLSDRQLVTAALGLEPEQEQLDG